MDIKTIRRASGNLEGIEINFFVENETNKGEATDMFILLERDDDPTEGSNLCYQYGGFDYNVSDFLLKLPNQIFQSSNLYSFIDFIFFHFLYFFTTYLGSLHIAKRLETGLLDGIPRRNHYTKHTLICGSST